MKYHNLQIKDHIWQHFLNLKQWIKTKESFENLGYESNTGFSSLNSFDANMDAIIHDGDLEIPADYNTLDLFGGKLFFSYAELETELVNVHRLYLPIIFGRLISDVFVITHMAQTLDGKICTLSGDSKWIGNQENLVHAHRLRALVDGVLVGGNTVAADLPKLNVRHVQGDNPCRILLTNTFIEWDLLPVVDDAKTILIESKNRESVTEHAMIDKVLQYSSSDLPDIIQEILVKLKTYNVDTLLVEGGPSTVGSFITAGAVDWLQLHIAPTIFGSGKSCIALPEIEKVGEGCKLNNIFYTTIGDAIMITGETTPSKTN